MIEKSKLLYLFANYTADELAVMIEALEELRTDQVDAGQDVPCLA